MDNTNNPASKKPNPKQKAVAIHYNPQDTAPKVVAKGQGLVAEKILETAAKSDIPIHKDEALVSELSKIDIGSQIPPELYEAVAQVLIFISDLDKLEGYKKNDK